MKVLVIGGIYDLGIENLAYETGKIIAEKGFTLVTGACNGSPYHAVLGASRVKKSKIIGFSPAKNKKEHISNNLNSPLDHYTKMIYHKGKFNFNKDQNLALIERELNIISFADIGIMLGGDTGAFFEFIAMSRSKKPIGVLTNSYHFSQKIPEIRELGVFYGI